MKAQTRNSVKTFTSIAVFSTAPHRTGSKLACRVLQTNSHNFPLGPWHSLKLQYPLLSRIVQIMFFVWLANQTQNLANGLLVRTTGTRRYLAPDITNITDSY